MKTNNKLYGIFNQFYNYLFPPVDIGRKFVEIQADFSRGEMKLYAQKLIPEDFKNKLLNLIGTQDEDGAIQLTMRIYLIVYEHPEYLRKDVNSQEFLDLFSPMPSESLANGRSIEHLSNTLDMNRLNYIIHTIL